MKQFLLLALFIFIVFAYLLLVWYRKKNSESKQEVVPDVKPEPSAPSAPTAPDECCGQHEVCEKESLLNTKVKPEYYDDEELDAFIQRDPTTYSEEEIAQFQNILYTMKEFDVAGWLKSLQLRQIELPESVKDEALMIVSERRSAK